MTGRAARVVAQAKVNLFLRVLAREQSGYHQIETLFCRLELGDDVVVRATDRGRSLDCRGADVGPAERNLAYRAAAAYADATSWPRGFAIEVDKRIPVGGGLGGGSADAGAVLRILNALAPRPVAPAELLGLAAPLGADVPFMTLESPLALAWGRGERLLTLRPLRPAEVLLFVLDEGVATADAYRWLDDSRGDYAPAPRMWSLDEFASWEAVARLAVNDFERPVSERHAGVRLVLPRVGELVRELRAEQEEGDAVFGLMSGSGSTLFVLYASEIANVFDYGSVRHESGVAAPNFNVRVDATATAERVAEVQVIE